MFGNFLTKRVAISAAAFAVVAVAGIATVSIIPALAAGVTGNNATAPAANSAKAGHQHGRAVAARRIAMAIFAESVRETGLTRTTVLKDLLNGETFAQIDGSKADAVETAVMAKITVRLNKAVAAGRISQARATTLSADATAGIKRLMTMNLSTNIRARFGGFSRTPKTSPPSSMPPSAAATTTSLPL